MDNVFKEGYVLLTIKGVKTDSSFPAWGSFYAKCQDSGNEPYTALVLFQRRRWFICWLDYLLIPKGSICASCRLISEHYVLRVHTHVETSRVLLLQEMAKAIDRQANVKKRPIDIVSQLTPRPSIMGMI